MRGIEGFTGTMTGTDKNPMRFDQITVFCMKNGYLVRSGFVSRHENECSGYVFENFDRLCAWMLENLEGAEGGEK